ncbi:MAG: DUF2799 domain-containing protein [Bdellovibrionales bacterium]|nr:DUF2799 domain-containing protein [Bdellovibrionales bacterium]
MMNWIVAVVSLLLISCQSLPLAKSKGICENLDWFEIGRSDGVQGLPSLKWQERQKACKGFSESNHQSYINGWYAGVDRFCSPSHGFTYGKTGLKYLDVCPTRLEEAFLQAYRKGLKVFLYESANERIAEELRNLSSQRETLAEADKKSLVGKIQTLEKEKQRNQNLISVIENEMEEESTL